MKKIVLVGNVACGKTTLCQRLNGLKLQYEKTQALNVVNCTIDTPGEYLEHRSLMRGLTVVSADTDYVVFVQDASRDLYLYSPGQAAAFPVPVIGVVSKADIATEKQIAQAKELLELTGADHIFVLSSYTGDGVQALIDYLQDDIEEKA